MRKKFIITMIILFAVTTPLAAFIASIDAPDPGHPPEMLPSDQYIRHTTTRIINAPQLMTKQWLENRRLTSFMTATEGLPSVVSTTPIAGIWGENGATRYANLDNGHTAIDRIIENRDPDLFHYQVFGFTAASRYIVDHIEGRIEYTALTPDQTRISWSYGIAPTSILTRPIASTFMENRIVPFMENTMNQMARAAEAELN
ncbi:hypothetical protein [Pseudaestuariivita rosea]|uniref:hypothetical protein n=1 Tax=Pseudaestuariivita rosea TaxID=2763263 RepID=UPI001ABB54CD|nr:hypothetical protein [Pseudaestuariivita rosea]